MPFYDVMVMDLLGTNLGDLFHECGSQFSIKTVLMLADQMISRLEYLHNMNMLHRDIKPENFVMGVGNTKNTLYLVDFGLSKAFRDVKTNQHMSFRDGKSLTGTVRYASVNTHQGIEATRRDDLESVGYVLVYFLRGFLPWQGIARKQSKRYRYSKVGDMKKTIRLEDLCDGCPKEFVEFLRYCRGLEFMERPDYARLRRIFRDLLKNLGCDYNYDYDWSGKVPLYS
jgi:serine/threonine protein kinase